MTSSLVSFKYGRVDSNESMLCQRNRDKGIGMKNTKDAKERILKAALDTPMISAEEYIHTVNTIS